MKTGVRAMNEMKMIGSFSGNKKTDVVMGINGVSAGSMRFNKIFFFSILGMMK